MVVLTGAGISAESGLPTFRDAHGLWEGHRPEEVATPEAFAADPDLVHRFYDERRAALDRVGPNPAHASLARLERELGDDLFLVTQNVDDLHERAGSEKVHHMHGRLRAARCSACGERFPWTGALRARPSCPACGKRALRPDVVWFGETPLDLDRIHRALSTCELFVAVGTSALVLPAAAFLHEVLAHGGRTLELNLEPTSSTRDFDQSRHGSATRLVPAWVEEILRAGG